MARNAAAAVNIPTFSLAITRSGNTTTINSSNWSEIEQAGRVIYSGQSGGANPTTTGNSNTPQQRQRRPLSASHKAKLRAAMQRRLGKGGGKKTMAAGGGS